MSHTHMSHTAAECDTKLRKYRRIRQQIILLSGKRATKWRDKNLRELRQELHHLKDWLIAEGVRFDDMGNETNVKRNKAGYVTDLEL